MARTTLAGTAGTDGTTGRCDALLFTYFDEHFTLERPAVYPDLPVGGPWNGWRGWYAEMGVSPLDRLFFIGGGATPPPTKTRVVS